MLQFQRLYFEGAGPYPKCEVPLADQGVVAILGKNGSGKSTIFKVLIQILFGESRDAIINRHSPELGFYGELEFSINETKYRIEQARKHPRYGSGMSIYEDGHDITRKNLRQVEKQVQEIIDFSREEFGNCVYLADLQSSTLLYGTGAQRDNYLSSLFSFDICDLALDGVKEEHQKVLELLDGRQKDIFTFDDLKARLREITPPSESDLDGLNLQLREKEEELQSLQQKLKSWVVISTKFKQRKELESQLEGLADVEPVDSELISSLEKRLRQAEKSKAIKSQRKAIIRKIRELPELKGDLQSLESKLRKSEAHLSKRTSELKLVEKREGIEAELSSLKEAKGVDPDEVKSELSEILESVVKCEVEIDTLSKRYKVLSSEEESKCPTCGNEIDNLDKVLEEIQERKKKVEHRHRRYQQRVSELKKLRGIADKLVSFKEKLADLPKGSSSEIESEIGSYSKMVSDLKSQVRSADLRSELERQLQELPRPEEKEDPDAISDRLTKLRNQDKKAKESARIKSALKDLPKSAPEERHLKKLEAKIDQLSTDITELEVKREKLKTSAAEWKKLNDKVESMSSVISSTSKWKVEEVALAGLKTAFGRNGLRLMALRRVLKSITTAIPKYINLLFQDRSMSVKMASDTFDFTVWRSKVEILKTMLSKGEKARLALALLLATRQAVPVKKRSNILVVDEILDGLDLDGVPSVFSAFDYLRSAERVGSIFMISPMSEIFEKKELLDRLDQKWLASKSRNESTMEMISCK